MGSGSPKRQENISMIRLRKAVTCSLWDGTRKCRPKWRWTRRRCSVRHECRIFQSTIKKSTSKAFASVISWLTWQQYKRTSFLKRQNKFDLERFRGGGIIVAREMTQLHIWKFVEDEVEYILSSLRQQLFGTLLAYSVIRNHWNFLYSIASETTTSLKSDPVVPSDLNFYWFLWHVASIVISITGIVYLVSCTVPFSNQRSCQERHRVFLTTS